MVKEKKPERGDKIVCPYCGERGTVLRVFTDNSVDVHHISGRRQFVGDSGKEYTVEAFLDGCSKHGKIGSNWHRPQPVKRVNELAGLTEEPL